MDIQHDLALTLARCAEVHFASLCLGVHRELAVTCLAIVMIVELTFFTFATLASPGTELPSWIS
jgi:hypothetical protein